MLLLLMSCSFCLLLSCRVHYLNDVVPIFLSGLKSRAVGADDHSYSCCIDPSVGVDGLSRSCWCDPTFGSAPSDVGADGLSHSGCRYHSCCQGKIAPTIDVGVDVHYHYCCCFPDHVSCCQGGQTLPILLYRSRCCCTTPDGFASLSCFHRGLMSCSGLLLWGKTATYNISILLPLMLSHSCCWARRSL